MSTRSERQPAARPLPPIRTCLALAALWTVAGAGVGCTDETGDDTQPGATGFVPGASGETSGGASTGFSTSPTDSHSGVGASPEGGVVDASGTTGALGGSATHSTTTAGGDAGTAADADGAPQPEADAKTDTQTGSDTVFGEPVPRAQSFWTANGRIHYGAEEVQLRGLNWFGLDGEALALFGPIESGRSVRDFLTQVKEWGFNALRIPLSPGSIRPGTPSASWAVRDGLTTGRAHFEELAETAADLGFYMLLDIHTCAVDVGYMAGGPGVEQCSGYDEATWLSDLRNLARDAETYAPHVVGIDLFNEPHSLSWPRWRALAERGGQAVLEENPRILVFVEGVGAEGYTGEHGPFWGENLTGAAQDPPALPESRLVYSPHVYGPSVYAQPYFGGSDFPGNMPAIWDTHFGFLFEGDVPVVVGEFGGQYTGSDRTWQDAFVDYLKQRGATSFFYWCLNPNSGDTGGLLQDDWRTPEQAKLDLLQELW